MKKRKCKSAALSIITMKDVVSEIKSVGKALLLLQYAYILSINLFAFCIALKKLITMI